LSDLYFRILQCLPRCRQSHLRKPSQLPLLIPTYGIEPYCIVDDSCDCTWQTSKFISSVLGGVMIEEGYNAGFSGYQTIP
jgi:hypothetical protein